MFHQAYVSIFNFLTDISATDAAAAIAVVVKRDFCNCAGKTGWGFFYIYIYIYFPSLCFAYKSVLPFHDATCLYRIFANQQQLNAARTNKECNGPLAFNYEHSGNNTMNVLREGGTEVRESAAAQLRGNANETVCTLYIK